MAKHNKKRNTAFIYEVLIREIIKQTINQNKEKRNIAIGVIKEIFKKGTVLRQELNLYKALLETKDLDPRVAERLMLEVSKRHKRIDPEQIFEEQSYAISVINKNISKRVFDNYVPHYKNLATIAQIFGDVTKPKTKVILEMKIIDKLSSKNIKKEQELKTSSLIVKSFIKRFNDTYGELLKEQKELLSLYVSSFQDNGTEFKFYMNEEIGRLKTTISRSYKLEEIQKDKALKNKLEEVATMLNDFNKKPLNKESFLQILKIQNLTKELEN